MLIKGMGMIVKYITSAKSEKHVAPKAGKFAYERFVQVNTSLKSNKASETRTEVSPLVPLLLLILMTKCWWLIDLACFVKGLLDRV